jgi:hypothetical protein
MLDRHEIEGLRRSAAMAPLSPSAIVELLDSCDQLVRQREQILTVLDDLAQSWTTVRSALNELHKIVAR